MINAAIIDWKFDISANIAILIGVCAFCSKSKSYIGSSRKIIFLFVVICWPENVKYLNWCDWNSIADKEVTNKLVYDFCRLIKIENYMEEESNKKRAQHAPRIKY